MLQHLRGEQAIVSNETLVRKFKTLVLAKARSAWCTLVPVSRCLD